MVNMPAINSGLFFCSNESLVVIWKRDLAEMKSASLIKRFATFLYESLTLIAIWLLCTLIFIALLGDVDAAYERLLLQFLLWAAAGIYFVVCWVKTGQTLAMQAWKIKLLNAENEHLNVRWALVRYVLATISLACFGAGYLWAILDKDQLFLHDRLLRTRLVQLARD